MIMVLATGILLGLTCGLAPGPLLALVLAQTLRHGAREGFKIAISPLLTDAPIIAATLFFAAKFAEFHAWLGILSLAGGMFVVYLAWDAFRVRNLEPGLPAEAPKSWLKGIVTNLASPHPWLFWLTVGAASLANAIAQSWVAAAAFLFGFYLALVGSKVLIALLAAQSRNMLTGRPYRVVMRTLALLLGGFALLLFREGVRNLAMR